MVSHRLSALRAALLDELVAEIMENAAHGTALVAVDGVDAAGKTVFAAQLARRLEVPAASTGRRVVHASVDDFKNPREVRYRRGRQSPEGFWLDSFDYEAFRAELLDPISRGHGRFRTAVRYRDAETLVDSPGTPVRGDEIAVIDGIFLHRDELRGYWTWSVFLDVPFAVSVARLAARDGFPADPDDPAVARYVGGQRLYLSACDPRRRAAAVIDNVDLDAPVRVTEHAG